MNHQFKTTQATIRHALQKKGIYLPNHYKNKTSVHYMKKIISGRLPYVLIKDVNWVTVPFYSELTPNNVII